MSPTKKRNPIQKRVPVSLSGLSIIGDHREIRKTKSPIEGILMYWNHKQLIVSSMLLCAFVSLVMVTPSFAGALSVKQPNVLIVLTDDQGYVKCRFI